MKRLTMILALVLIVAACGDDDTSETATTTAASPQTTAATVTTAPTTTTTVAVAETTTTVAESATTAAPATGASFEITSVSFGSPMVVITNIGDATGSLSGHFLCQRPSYVGIPDVELAAGESLAISLGGNVFLPPPGAITIDQQLSLGSLGAGGGEIGLYSSNSFGSADAIVSYVEWGNTGHGRSGTAVEAGIWDNGGFVPTTGDTAVIQLTSLESTGSTAWSGF